jgi:cell shape-determining protein MreC
MYESIKNKSRKRHIISQTRPDTKFGSIRKLLPTVAAILFIISISIIVLSCLNLIIDNRISNSKVIKEVANAIMLPLFVFYDNDKYILDNTNGKYIESMQTHREDRSVPSDITGLKIGKTKWNKYMK